MTRPARTFYRRRGKRWLDLALAIPALVVLSPVLLLLTLTTLLLHGRPVLFRQRRPGLKGVPFIILKFRSMTDRRDRDGSLLPDSQRLTSYGRFLRRTSLDELPELVNVAKGEMSLVGPRPLLMRYLERYSADQMRRHDVRPGITCLPAISGRNKLPWEQRFELDLWYVGHVSLRLDSNILARTILKVLGGKGTNTPGHATVPEFEEPQDDA